MTYKNLITEFTEDVETIISEVIEYNFENTLNSEINKDELTDLVNDEIFDFINNTQYVIYTHQAKQISGVINQYDPFDTSDITGERFDNWSQVAFENIYYLIYNKLDVEELINENLGEE